MQQFACPSCGQSVDFDAPDGDQSVQCPHCSETLRLSTKPSAGGTPTIVLTLSARANPTEKAGQPITRAQITDTTQAADRAGAAVDPRVHLVLAQWEKAWRDGKDLDPDELVRDCPEILPQVLKGMEAMRALADIVNFTAYIVPTLSELPGGEAPEHPEVPGYEIIKELGHGGMGVVYQAHQVKLGRLVALKMLLGHAPVQKQQLNRFRREAKTIANLDHPNIVQLYDFGQYKKRPYFTLEFVSGGDLAKRLKREPLPVDAAVVLMEQLAHAIAYAHREGVIHRDLKPQNILLTPDGLPKITDFGLVKQVEQTDGGTETDVIMGSPPYMPPEQAQGMNRTVGPAADVYSLGAILYECLTGRPPFIAPTPMETLKRVTEEDPIPPRRLQPAIPKDVETVCLKCLRKDPEKRYDSAESLAEDLRRIRNREPILARPVSHVERFVKWVKRRPTAASFLGGAVLFTAVAVAAVIWAFGLAIVERNNLKKVKQQLETRNQELESERRTQEKMRLHHDWRTHGAKLREAQMHWQAGDYALAEKTLDQCRWDLCDWVVDRLRSELSARCEVFRGHREPVLRVAFIGDGARIASASADQSVIIWDIAKKTIVHRWRNPGETIRALAIRPKANQFVTGSDKGVVRLRDLSNGKIVREFNGPDGHTKPINTVAICPSGRWIAAAGDDRTIKIWHTDSTRLLQTLRGHAASITSLAVSSDERFIVSAAIDGAIKIWQLDASPNDKTKLLSVRAVEIESIKLTLHQAHAGAIQSVAIQPTSEARDNPALEFASAGDDHTIKIWKLQLAKNAQPIVELQRTLIGHRGVVRHIEFSADGKQIVSASADGTARVWQIDKPHAAEIYRGHHGAVNAVVFHPNGHTIASAGDDETIRIWPGANERRDKSIIAPKHGVQQFALASGGTVLATIGKHLPIQLWDTGSGKLQCALSSKRQIVWRHLAFNLGAAMLCASSSDRVAVWNIAERKVVDEFPVPRGADRPVAFHPTKNQIAYVADDPISIAVRDIVQRKQIALYEGHSKPIGCLAFSTTGRWLAAGSADGGVRLWNTTADDVAFALESHGARVTHVAFSKDEKWIASAGDDFIIKIGRPAKGAPRRNLIGHSAKITGLAFHPNGRLLLSRDAKNRLVVWHIPTERILMTFTEFTSKGGRGLTLSADGRTLAFLAGDAVHVWRNAAAPKFRTIHCGGSDIKGLAHGVIDAGEEFLAYTTSDAAVRIWDMVRGRETATLLKHRGRVNSVAIASKQKLLASAGSDGKIFLYQLGSNKVFPPLLAHGKSVTGVAFSPDGTMLASSSLDHTVMIWDVAKRRLVHTLKEHKAGVRCLAFDNHNKWLASGGVDGSVLLWNAGDATLVKTLSNGNSLITSLAFGAGPYLAASRRDGSMTVWSIPTGKVHLAWKPNEFAVSRVLFSPDGKWLLSAGDDEAIHIWNTATGKESKTLHGHATGIANMAFSSDGEWLISGDRSGKIRCWQWNAHAPGR